MKTWFGRALRRVTFLKKIEPTFWFLHRSWKKRFRIFLETLSVARAGGLRVNVLHPYATLAGREIGRIHRGDDTTIALTRAPGTPIETVQLRSSQILAIEAEDLVFEPTSEILAQNTRYFRQPLARRLGRRLDSENLYSASSLIMWNSSNLCIRGNIQVQPLRTLPEGILLNGQACNNWYHWLINILPKAFIAETYLQLGPKIPYLVSRSIQGTRMEEALRLVIGDDREVVFLDHGLHKVQRGIVIEAPVREVYRPKNILSPINWSKLGAFHSEIMAQYRSYILERVKQARLDVTAPTPAKIFLARDNVRRPYNQNEVGALLQRMGFAPVSLEQHPFTEQVALLADATIVVGPTGAQWAGWLFSERAVGLVLLPRFLTRSSLFAKLGAAGSSELLEILIDSDDISWDQYFTAKVEASVDVSLLRRAVQLIAERASPSKTDK